jgi:predicted nucleic-acid-binding protein
MIGIDTNILVRAFLEDDKEQAQEAQDFLAKATKDNILFISSYAILEFAWVLKVKNFARKEIYEAIISLTDSTGVVISQKDVVLEALAKYLAGKADFGDYMIWADGEQHKSRQVKTFDIALQKELQEKNA